MSLPLKPVISTSNLNYLAAVTNYIQQGFTPK